MLDSDNPISSTQGGSTAGSRLRVSPKCSKMKLAIRLPEVLAIPLDTEGSSPLGRELRPVREVKEL